MTAPARRPALSYVVPVHNQEAVLAATVDTLVERLREHPGSEVLLVENGSTDGSPDLVERLAREHAGDPVRVVAATSAKGLGHAWRRGMELAGGDLVVLTAADLPFLFTDLDAALALDPRPGLVIGSKAHRRSVVQRTAGRQLMSLGFRALRALLLGLRVGDSQGTLLLDAALARAILPELRSADFFIGTEIVAVAAAQGQRPVEVPVTLVPRDAGTTVSPVRDSLRMAAATWRLGARLREARRTATYELAVRPRLSPAAAHVRELVLRGTRSPALADLATLLAAAAALAVALLGFLATLAAVGLSVREVPVLHPSWTLRPARVMAAGWALGLAPLLLGVLLGLALGLRRRGAER